jgi:spore maturation protein CgeB
MNRPDRLFEGLRSRSDRAPRVRAVIAADLSHWSTGEGLAVGLRLHGWLVHEIDLRPFAPATDTVPLKLARKAVGQALWAAYNRKIVEACDALGADIFIGLKGTNIRPATIRELHHRSVMTSIYYTDYHFQYAEVYLDTIREVGLLATTKSFQLEWLEQFRQGRPSIHLPHGYPPLVELASAAPPSEEKYEYDIAYIGNPSRPKRDLLAKVAEAYPDRRIVVAGNGWRRAAKGTALEPFVLGHPLVGDMLAELHRTSRINIAIHMQTPVSGWVDLVSRRTFEIPAFHGFMLHVDNEEVRSLYDVPGEIDVFCDADELVEKIGIYLADPTRRKQMIERARARAVPDYGHHSRGIELARQMEALLDKRRGA